MWVKFGTVLKSLKKFGKVCYCWGMLGNIGKNVVYNILMFFRNIGNPLKMIVIA